MAAAAVGVSFQQLCINILEMTLGREVKDSTVTTRELEEQAC